jgi:predicted alpha/beta hydrolase family esterase
MPSTHVLMLPGWQGSSPAHWQSRWELRHGYQRVEQHDWMRPLRGDWMAQLEEAFIARSSTGRAAMRIHGLSSPERIFW